MVCEPVVIVFDVVVGTSVDVVLGRVSEPDKVVVNSSSSLSEFVVDGRK